MAVERHGIESHFVRPDRVYATSVWTPIVGYQPTSDAMQVAARFVQDRGLAGVGLLGRMRYRRIMRKQAQGVGGLGFAIPSVGGVFSWLRNLLTIWKAKVAANQIMKQLTPPPGAVVTVDTSPRATPAAQIVDAVRGLLPAPLMSSPQSSANAIAAGAVAAVAPTHPQPIAALTVAPAASDMALYLSNRWREGY